MCTVPLSVEINATKICQTPMNFAKFRIKADSFFPRCLTREPIFVIKCVFSIIDEVHFTSKVPKCLRLVKRKRKKSTDFLNCLYFFINSYRKGILINLLQHNFGTYETFKWNNTELVFSNTSIENNFISRYIVPHRDFIIRPMSTNEIEQISLFICLKTFFKSTFQVCFTLNYRYFCTVKTFNYYVMKNAYRTALTFSNFMVENIFISNCISMGNTSKRISNQPTSLFRLQWRNNQAHFNISHVFFHILKSLKTEMCFRAKTTNFSFTIFYHLCNAFIRKSELLTHEFEVMQEKSQTPYSVDSFGVIKNNFVKQLLFLISQYKLCIRGFKYKIRFDKLNNLFISHTFTCQLPVHESTPKLSFLTFRYGRQSLSFTRKEQETCGAAVTYNTSLENSRFIGNYSKTTQTFTFNSTSKKLIKSHCNSSFITENASVKRTQQRILKKKPMRNHDYQSLLFRRKRELLQYRSVLAHGISPKVKRQNLLSLDYASQRQRFNKFTGHSGVMLSIDNQDLNMYKQSVNCKLPTFWCFGRKPSFDSRNIPQFVYFTFDGIVDKISREKIAHLFSQDRTNENGCHVRATIFITGLASDYKEVNWLYKAGHEIALYGLSNDIVDPTMKHLEIPVQKKLLESYAGISDLYVTGWRNVYDTSDWHKQLDSLKKYNMVYDSSIVIKPSNVREQGIWPFTLELGWDENCKNSSCRFKAKKSEGLWEIPSILYSNFKTSKSCYYIDECFNDSHTPLETYDYLVRNFFIAHKSKTPFGVRLRKYWFTKQNKSNFGGLDAFIKFLVDLDNVYLISISDLVGWMRHPQPIFTKRNIKNFLGIGC